MPSRPFVSLTYAEGDYFDLWMIVHFINGLAGGFSNVFWALPFTRVLALAAGLMIVWELGEFALGVRESWSNVVLDVVVGLVGVLLATSLATQWSYRGEVVAFIATLSVGVLLSTLGWLAAYRRKHAR